MQVVYYGCDNAVWFAKNKVFEIDSSKLGQRASIFWYAVAALIVATISVANTYCGLCQDSWTDCYAACGFD